MGELIKVSITRYEFLKLPMETRRRLLTEQADQLAKAHRESPDRGTLERDIEAELSQYGSELMGWKSLGMNSVEQMHNLKVESAKLISALFDEEGIECYVQCSRCGEKVSNTVKSSIPEGLVVRAFIECSECVAKQPDEEGIREELIKQIEKEVFYVDSRGYVALKPNATGNWEALKKGAK